LAEGGVTTDHDSQNLVKESGRAVSIAMQKLLDAASAASTRVGDSQKYFLKINNVINYQ
jgi:hypothetical protein